MIAGSLQDEAAVAQAELEQYLDQQSQDVEDEFDLLQQAIIERELQFGQFLLAKKNALKREYKQYLEQKGFSVAKANKHVRLWQTFADFPVRCLYKISLDTLHSLTQPRYKDLVERLRHLGQATQVVVEQMLKEMRLSKPPAVKEPISGWKQDASGGGRHYLVQLYDEATGVAIEKVAKRQGVLPQKVVVDAIAEYSRNVMLKTSTDWCEIAELVERDRGNLLHFVRNWSNEARTRLSILLSESLESGSTTLNDVQWVPEKLLYSSLNKLFFTVRKIVGSDNLVEVPRVEHFSNCKFVMLHNFATSTERWVFESGDNKQLVVHRREDFDVERF